MKLALSLLAAVAVLGVTSAAHATPITYTLTNVTTSLGYSVTGSIIIDNSTGVISGGSITENGNVYYNTLVNSPASDYAEFSAQGGIPFYLYIDTTNLPQLCTTISNPHCSSTSYISAYVGLPSDPQNTPLVSGTLVPQTPEPSGLVLLGTGILGVAGVARRRFVKA